MLRGEEIVLRAKNCATLLLVLTIVASLPAIAQTSAEAQQGFRTLSLNGVWKFITDPSGSLNVSALDSAANSRRLEVPGSWQSVFADLRDYAGVAWYWRTVEVEQLDPGEVALLHFGAVDYHAGVFVNGRLVGSHNGGYLPFEFDVTSFLNPGVNQIAVRVVDPGCKPSEVEGIRYAEIPHGKQSWYIQTSGIWQAVELKIRPRTHLGLVHVTAEADGRFNVSVHIVNLPADGTETGLFAIAAKISDPEGTLVWQGRQPVGPQQRILLFTGNLENAKLWSPSDPALYTLQVRTSNGDSESCRFGFRTFETRNGKFYLNGQLIYLRGALDQGFYPDTIYTPPSLDFLKKEMLDAKAMGLNLLRCHIKVPDPRYLEAADETGMLVWYEIPSWDRLSAASERRALATLRGMVQRDWNHPSIVIVSIVNESWGVDLKEAAGRAWLKDAYQEAKKLVPGWLVDDNSACCRNFHLETDLADFHRYDSIPDHAADFDRFVGDLATRPSWLFSPYGDGAPKGDEPLMLSEFGNWGLPFVPEIKPWWFTADYTGRRAILPRGIERRFAEYQYGTLFPDLHALEAATQQHEFKSLRYEISTLRSEGSIQGYVITELTDVMWESNGLMDMWRHPKNFSAQLGSLQQDDAVTICISRHNFFSGSKAQADLYFSHYSQRNLSRAKVVWSVEGTSLAGSFALPGVPVGSAMKVGKISFTVPVEAVPSQNVLSAEVVAGNGTVAENSIDLYFYPHEEPELPPVVSFHDPSGSLRRLQNGMSARDYFEASEPEAHPVLITSVFDGTVKKAVEAGGVAILLADSAETLAPGLEIVPREGILAGNWISNFAWVRKNRQPFKKIGFETLLGFECEAVTPETVVRGVPGSDFQDVLAGDFYGWIHSNVGTLVQARYGKGKLLICTFALETAYGTDPYATYLLDALANYAASGFAPRLTIPAQNP